MPPEPLERFIVSGVIGVVEYNDIPDIISRFFWSDPPSGVTGRIVVFDDEDPEPGPVVDIPFVAAGNRAIAGNRKAVIETDPDTGEMYPAIPPSIKITFLAVSQGTS